MTLRAGLVTLVLAAGMLAACGGQSSTSATSTSSLTRISTTEAKDSPDSSSSTTRETTPSETTESETTDIVGFTSPSGNVGCMIDPQFVRCDVAERDWTPPPRPADCEFDYGQGISMSDGEEPEFNCVGDTAQGGTYTLEYGKSIAAGTLSCESAESGMTCRDSTTGHGFTIAREQYRIF